MRRLKLKEVEALLCLLQIADLRPLGNNRIILLEKLRDLFEDCIEFNKPMNPRG